MHPEIRQDHPGNCPICGMTLEPLIPLDEEDNSELVDFQRRFWWTLPLTLVVTFLAGARAERDPGPAGRAARPAGRGPGSAAGAGR